MNVEFILNRDLVSVDVHPATPLLHVIRNICNDMSVKEGCGEGECGACTVLLGKQYENNIIYKNVASCLILTGSMHGRHIVTIDGINESSANYVQQCFLDYGGSQCGFCTPGFVLSFTAFLMNSREFSKEDAIRYVDGNICRCTGYMAIKNVAQKLVENFQNEFKDISYRIPLMIKRMLLPAYFREVKSHLSKIKVPEKSENHGVLVAGGSDYLIQHAQTYKEKNVQFVYERNIPDAISYDEKKQQLTIGAAATIEEIRTDSAVKKHFPEFQTGLDRVSSTLIRNSATIGGNIANASPIADLAVMLLVTDCRVSIRSASGKQRFVPLSEFYKGYKKINLNNDEWIDLFEIYFKKKGLFNFEKVAGRAHLDIASCNSAIMISVEKERIKTINISAGGVFEYPLLLKKTAAFFTGKKCNNETLQEGLNHIDEEIAPISDVRGAKEYKAKLLKHLVFSHFTKLFPEKITLQP